MSRARVLGKVAAGVLVLGQVVGLQSSRAESPQRVKAREVAEKLETIKVISIQDYGKINAIDQEGMAGVWGNSPVNEYDRNYRQRLREYLGISVILVRSKELLSEMDKVADEDAERLADLWIREATEVKNVIVIGHCGAPITPHGNDRIPYLIRDHIHSNKKWFGPDDVPTATTVSWPADETVTVAKFDVYRRKLSVYVGTVLDGNLLFDDFDNRICRNKMVVRIQHLERCYMLPSGPKEGAFRNWWGSWGCHQVVLYGDLRESLREFAALSGFEMVGYK